MKLTLQLPGAMEVLSSEYDAKTRQLSLQPRFYTSGQSASLGLLTIESENGTIKREFLLSVSGSTGAVTAQEAKASVSPNFDKLTPEEFSRKQAARAEAIAKNRNRSGRPKATT